MLEWVVADDDDDDINAEVLWITDCTYVVSVDRLSHAGRSENRGLSICQVLIASLKHHSSSLEHIRRRIQGKARPVVEVAAPPLYPSRPRKHCRSRRKRTRTSSSMRRGTAERRVVRGRDCSLLHRVPLSSSSFLRVRYVMRVGEGVSYQHYVYSPCQETATRRQGTSMHVLVGSNWSTQWRGHHPLQAVQSSGHRPSSCSG